MKRKTYGVPYSGSKNKLAEDIIALLPKGKRLVDLFAGGCAITHCALLSDKWVSIWSKKRGGLQPVKARERNTTRIEHLFVH